MNISSISSAYTSSTTSSITSASSLLATYHDEVVTSNQSSFGYSQDSICISSQASQSAPPDFENMSIEDYKAHLTEIQSTLADLGYTFDFDVDSLTDEELSSLKDSMGPVGGKGGKNPPPPPPPSEIEETSSTSTDLLDILLESLQETDEENAYQTVQEMLELYSELV